MQRRSNDDVLEEVLDIKGAEVIDVGCGEGHLARWLTRRGAHVPGIEVSPRALAKAQANAAVGDEHYIQGFAEDLPVANRSADVVIFFNSLHHVDADGLATAIKEASRVLKFGGVLYVSEPLAEGAYFDLMKPAHDETRPRLLAYQALQFAPDYGFVREREILHINAVPLRDFEQLHDRITSINPHVRARFDENEELIRENFDKLGVKTDDGWDFDQPLRVTVLRK